MPPVYDELRRLAGRYLRRERPGHTLQATALVHEAHLRLLKDKPQSWQDEAHFRAIAATSMRRILIERARAHGAAKRGGSRVRVTLDDGIMADTGKPAALLAIDAALTRLDEIDPHQARIVELRFFGGLTVEEVAEALGVSPATVKRSWSVAKAWLKREVRKGDSSGS